MEEEIQAQKPSKFSRLVNGRTDTSGELKRSNLGTGNGAIDVGRSWPNSSRIIRVSRASGGKDRHSKVWTSKGLRDRRVRLSVTTAIQFYDLQDRLGYDQPSKAVEWLIKAAADAINELPSLNGSFPDTPKQVSDEKRTSDGVEQGFEDQDRNYNQNQNQNFSLSCSSNSDTSKGSGLSLSRSDVRVSRVKARERARERTAKDKDKDSSLNSISQNSSFTELLTGGISSLSNNKAASVREWHSTPMDYFNTAHNSTGFPGQIHLGHSIPQAMTMSINQPFSFSGENNNQDQQLQHFPSFLSDHLIPASQQQGPSGDYNLNFTISSGLAGFNRGTLQSNSSLPHLHRFSSSNSPIDTASNSPFFMENHHHHHQQFPPGLQLYGEGSSRHSDHKGKGKN